MTLTALPEGTGRGAVRKSCVLAVLLATALGASGRFHAALALTAGTAVAIVSLVWLASVAGRLFASDPRKRAKLGFKFALGAALRYLFLGAAIFGAVHLFPSHLPWLLAGLSVGMLGAVADEFVEIRREKENQHPLMPGLKTGPD